jgi:hypothetical protein
MNRSGAPSGNEAADGPLAELQASVLVMEPALAGTRDFTTAAELLPTVATANTTVVPRAYATVGAYLRASRYAFQESTFVAFLGTIQEVRPLRLRELWALKSLTQLVLLKEIGRAARALPDRNENVNTSGNGADLQLRIRHLVANLRATDVVSWEEINEQIGEANRTLLGDPCGAYAQMDKESRDSYLQAIDHLGRTSDSEEIDIARVAIGLARSALNEWNTNPRLRDRRSHVGFYLVGRGRPLLERQIRYRPPMLERFRTAILSWPEVYYFVGIELLTFAIIAFLVIGARAQVSLVAALILLSLPVTEAAWGVMNQLVVSLLPPKALPKLDFSQGIPRDFSTIVVVPTLLLNEAFIRRMVTELEIRYLGNRDPHLYFALLTDAPDSRQRFDKNDELVSLCCRLIEELNIKYAAQGNAPFFLFHRFRTFNPSEGSWMGWERKRGKLLDLNDLLRTAKDSFPVKVGKLSVLPSIKYVIVMDSDTQLPHGVAHRLVGAMAHPLNRALIDPRTNTVVEGYGMLQPRVGISVQSASRSRLANIYSGQTGWDIYTHAVSDVYQDLFGEGTFVGKGIYEVDVFRHVLGDRFPTNAILSHDLIEGNYTRAGLVSDVEIIDDYPTHFSAYSRRKHRWVRGDWQVMSWLLPRVPDAQGKRVPNPLSLLSRWKIFDNLRRSLVEAATFVLLLAGWLSLPGSPRRWTFVVVVLLLIPAYLQLALSLLKTRIGPGFGQAMKDISRDFVVGQINIFFMLAFLSHQTLVVLDAVIRTIVRVTITRKKLLEWETAAEAEAERGTTPVDRYLAWTPWLSLVIAVVLGLGRPAALPVATPFLILWACAGPLARWLDRPLPLAITTITPKEEEFLRSASLRTWRFFRQYASKSENYLAPDNIQEDPHYVDHRISPTNLGLLMNSQLAAYELGYLTLPEFVAAVEHTMETTGRLYRFQGHFVNWYDTQTLEALEPMFISSVDNGNLACSLWTLKQGCLKALQDPLLRDSTWRGLRDHIDLLDQLANRLAPNSNPARALGKINARIELLPELGSGWVCALPGLAQDLREIVGRIDEKGKPAEELRWWMAETIRRVEAIQDMLDQLIPSMLPHNRSLLNQISTEVPGEPSTLTLRTLGASTADLDAKLEGIPQNPAVAPIIRLGARALRERLPNSLSEADSLQERLTRLAGEAEKLIQEMDFRLFYSPAKKVLSLGYDVSNRRGHTGSYDLLASEARSAVFAAIAKGDIPQESWFALGRSQALWKGESVLLSWSGTAFEYLMPALWFEHRPRTLLGESVRAAVSCQMEWPDKSIPWGISEAAYSTQDESGHYQYRAFGIPFLALNPACHKDPVISPYSSFLALNVNPHPAVENLERMHALNWVGELGFYDAIDFAPERVGPHGRCKVVRCWMAHHQGMSLLAACNLLTGGVIHKLFHSEPAVRATELLLHEKPAPGAERVAPAENGQDTCTVSSSKGDDHETRA